MPLLNTGDSFPQLTLNVLSGETLTVQPAARTSPRYRLFLSYGSRVSAAGNGPGAPLGR